MSYIADEFPKFLIDEKNGEIRIEGISLMDVAQEFYQPVMVEIKDYISTNPEKTNLFINLRYFNTPSSKYILDILKQFIPLYNSGKNVKVLWYYDEDDEDMHEAGVDFNALVNVPFELIPTKFTKS